MSIPDVILMNVLWLLGLVLEHYIGAKIGYFRGLRDGADMALRVMHEEANKMAKRYNQ